jgi:hypothetical protein
MQQSSGRLSHSKHRKAFGKGNRNATNNILTAKEINEQAATKQKQEDSKKPEMFGSIKELAKAKRTRS